MHLPESRIAVLVADRYHEIGFWYHLLRFRKEAASVTVIAPQPAHEYRGELGYLVIAYIGVGDASPIDDDAVILPGHADAQAAKDMLDFLDGAWRRGSVIGASAQASGAPASAGLLQGRTARRASAISGAVARGWRGVQRGAPRHRRSPGHCALRGRSPGILPGPDRSARGGPGLTSRDMTPRERTRPQP